MASREESQALLRGIRSFASEVSHWQYPAEYVNILDRSMSQVLRDRARRMRESVRDEVLGSLRSAASLVRSGRFDDGDALFEQASFTWSRWEAAVATALGQIHAHDDETYTEQAVSAVSDFGEGIVNAAGDAVRGAASATWGVAAPILAIALLGFAASQRRRPRI